MTIPLETALADMAFQPLTANSLETLRPLVADQPWRTCDFTIGGLGLWADWFGYRVSVADDGATAVVSGSSEGDPRLQAYSLPLGRDFERAALALKEHCRRAGMPLRFSAVPEAALPLLKALGAKSVQEQTAWADYLYEIEALASLSGKRYNKKRNHVNRFHLDHPGARLLELDETTLPAARAFVAALPTGHLSSPTALYEHRKIAEALAGYAVWGFEGAMLVDEADRPLAVTFGECVGDTLHLHAEKIDHSVAGAGEAVNTMFAARMLGLHPGLVYVNRQDDAGDEGLRQAKLSWHPAALLKKFDVVV